MHPRGPGRVQEQRTGRTTAREPGMRLTRKGIVVYTKGIPNAKTIDGRPDKN